jgi:hypothetical protein
MNEPRIDFYPHFTLLSAENHPPLCVRVTAGGAQQRLYRAPDEYGAAFWRRMERVAIELGQLRGMRALVHCMYDLREDDPRSDEFMNLSRACIGVALDMRCDGASRVHALSILALLHGMV